jgi:hypothetical protein
LWQENASWNQAAFILHFAAYDWWHQINVESIDDVVPKGKYPKIINRVGKSPPQYLHLDEE